LRKLLRKTESNLQVQCNSHKNANDILHRNRKINFKIHIKACNTLNRPSNPQQGEQCWMYHSNWLQIILQSHNDKNSMVLHKNKHRLR
jgi:hypothetical protein